MKQETINLIKSMTKQGFLVIVDPEIYNGNATPIVISEKYEGEPNPEPSVIFTNCVGEVFTEEDVKKNIEVWVGSISGKGLNKILNCPICDLTRDIFRGNDYETDIFRSKKSLLKYLYETCD